MDDFKVAIRFSGALEGEALKFFNSLPHTTQESWLLCETAFQERFGINQDVLRGGADLDSISLKSGETAIAFGYRYLEALSASYPDEEFTMNSVTGPTLGGFLRAIGNQDAVTFIKRQRPKVKHMQDVCDHLQVYLESMVGSFYRPLPTTRIITSDSEPSQTGPGSESVRHQGDDQQASNSLQKLVEQLAAIVLQQQKGPQGGSGKSKKNKKFKQKRSKYSVAKLEQLGIALPHKGKTGLCWLCGSKEGHSCRNCPTLDDLLKSKAKATPNQGEA